MGALWAQGRLVGLVGALCVPLPAAGARKQFWTRKNILVPLRYDMKPGDRTNPNLRYGYFSLHIEKRPPEPSRPNLRYGEIPLLKKKFARNVKLFI